MVAFGGAGIVISSAVTPSSSVNYVRSVDAKEQMTLSEISVSLPVATETAVSISVDPGDLVPGLSVSDPMRTKTSEAEEQMILSARLTKAPTSLVDSEALESPIRLTIPKIGVDATIVQVGVAPDGSMDTPKGPADVAWFNLGPYPGDEGSAVISGHYGWKDNIPAVFDDLHTLHKGDKLYVEDEQGVTTTFVVRETRVYDEHQDATDIFVSHDGTAHLNLITLRESFFDNTLDGLAYCQIIFDAYKHPVDCVYLEVNKNFETLTGLRNVVGKRVTEVIPGIFTSHPELLELCGRVSLTKGAAERFEIYIEPFSKWFFVSVYSPKKNFFVTVFQDITDRKQVEKNLEDANRAARNVLEDLQLEKEALAHAKAKDEALLESIGEGLIAVDNDRKIVVINKVAERMLGWDRKELVGKELTDLPLEDEAGDLISLDKRPTNIALTTGEVTKATCFFVRKDTTRFPMAITATPIKLDGKTIGLIEIIRDITHEREVDKAKNEFISLASHQLRSPLTTISWYTEMILNGDVGQVATDQRKYLEEIYQGNQHMVELVNTLLDISRIELGTFQIEPQPTDIVALAREALEELRPTLKSKKILVTERFGEDIPAFSTDPKLLYMVFQNLLGNAVEYTPSGGAIGLAIALCDKKSICITISDTGCGIPKSQQATYSPSFFGPTTSETKIPREPDWVFIS